MNHEKITPPASQA